MGVSSMCNIYTRCACGYVVGTGRFVMVSEVQPDESYVLMWTLVFIWIYNGEPNIRKVDTYPDMYECFTEYDKLYYAMPPESRLGVRLTCVKGDTNEVLRSD